MSYLNLTLPNRRYPVRADAVVRHVQRWLDARAESYNVVRPAGALSPIAQLSALLGRKDVSRQVWRLQHESEYVSLQVADMFISAIDPSLWQTDPDLAAALNQFPPANDDELLDDEEIYQWAIDTRESMTPAAWRRLCVALAWFAPEFEEAA